MKCYTSRLDVWLAHDPKREGFFVASKNTTMRSTNFDHTNMAQSSNGCKDYLNGLISLLDNFKRWNSWQTFVPCGLILRIYISERLYAVFTFFAATFSAFADTCLGKMAVISKNCPSQFWEKCPWRSQVLTFKISILRFVFLSCPWQIFKKKLARDNSHKGVVTGTRLNATRRNAREKVGF